MGRNDSLLRKISDMSQIAGIRGIEYSSGRARGVRALEIHNQAGLRFTVLPDKCMDLMELSCKGVNLSFPSKNGIVGNAAFSAAAGEFPHYWSAGLLSTCGLGNTGPGCIDDGISHPTHGRIGMTPADLVSTQASWAGDRYEMAVQGAMKESRLFGSALQLTRRVRTAHDSLEITIEDTIENLEPEAEEFMILYHFNFGYPLLDEGARIVKPNGPVRPRNADAAAGLAHCLQMSGPIDGCPEQVFFHENQPDANGFTSVALVNDRLQLGVRLRYKTDTLPFFAEWKSMRSHDYALGLEPGNSSLLGRCEERRNGTLQSLPGYGRLTYALSLAILDGAEAIGRFEDECR